MERLCANCEHFEVDTTVEPCKGCFTSHIDRPNFEPKGEVKMEDIKKSNVTVIRDVAKFLLEMVGDK